MQADQHLAALAGFVDHALELRDPPDASPVEQSINSASWRLLLRSAANGPNCLSGIEVDVEVG